MSLISWPPRTEVVFWLVTGYIGAWTLYSIKQNLEDVKEVTRVTKEEKPMDFLGQRTEDAISLETLDDLCSSSNYNIRQASIKILIERALQDKNLDLLLRNAQSKDVRVREEAMVTLAYLAANLSRNLAPQDPRMLLIYRVVIDVLVSYLPASAERVHDPYTDWRLRSKIEDCAFEIMQMNLVTTGGMTMKQWLKAGMVTRWLAQYPFGGPKAKNLNKKEMTVLRYKIIDAIKACQSDDENLEFIFQELIGDNTAKPQLRKHDLMGSSRGAEDTSFAEYRYGRPYVSPQLRRIEYDTEREESQAARRRRRREAVVIGDAGQPISQDNIFNADAQDMEADDTMDYHS